MNSHLVRRFLFGLLLIGVGGLFLAGQLGYLTIDPAEIVPTYWPVILIILGLSGLSGLVGHKKHGGSGSYMWSLFLLLLGIGFLLRNLGYVSLDMGDYIKLLIPVFIILFGIRMIFKPSGRMDSHKAKDYSYKYEYKYEYGPQQTTNPAVHADPSVYPDPGAAVPPAPHGHETHSSTWTAGENRSGFIGDLYLGHDYWELKPMNVSHFIGDTIIDLTKAQIPFGETRLNVSAFIGDVRVFVPNDVDVEFNVSSSSFLGDITVFNRREGGFLRSMREETPGYALADKKIRLQCSLFIGDIHVQRVG